jgi:hypothetical protein
MLRGHARRLDLVFRPRTTPNHIQERGSIR